MGGDKRYARAMILNVLALFGVLWVLINARDYFFSGILYVIMAVVNVFLYTQWKKIGNFI